jgi:hypothetical protein
MCEQKEETDMELIRQIVDSSTLAQALSLPKSFQNRKVEITVRPINEEHSKPVIDKVTLGNMMDGSVTQSLIGAISHSDISLDEIKAERLRSGKYAPHFG